jgi:hypothetical protein
VKSQSAYNTTPSSSLSPTLPAFAAETCDSQSPLEKEVILKQYADIITGVGQLDGKIHLKIDPAATPVQMPPRRLPVAIKERVELELDAMCWNGITEPVTEPSQWISALVVVLKSNGKVGACIDPKYLNKALKRNVFPMPTIDDVLPRLTKAKVFSTLDATQGFTHLRLDRETAALTTFETPFGRYRWLRLAYGLSPSSEIFQVECSNWQIISKELLGSQMIFSYAAVETRWKKLNVTMIAT